MSIDIAPVTYRDVLPAYPGYAIGNLIRKAALLKPELESELKKETAKLTVQQEEHKKITEQGAMNTSSARLNVIRENVKKIQNKINELGLQDDLLGPKFEETLPLNSASRMIIDSRSFASIKHDSFTIKEKAKVDSEVGNLISKLFPEKIEEEMRPSLAPDRTLESFKKSIQQMLEKEGELSIIGSFITLVRVRRMDPIIIRPNAIGSKLKDNADKYYVLTEAVLGAVFLGVASHVSGSGERGNGDEKKNQVRASASRISYICQGAIPRTSKKSGVVNLQSVYDQWLSALQDDQDSGYPIGFRYRELKDVLWENGIKLNIRNDLALPPQKGEEKEKPNQLLLEP